MSLSEKDVRELTFRGVDLLVKKTHEDFISAIRMSPITDRQVEAAVGMSNELFSNLDRDIKAVALIFVGNALKGKYKSFQSIDLYTHDRSLKPRDLINSLVGNTLTIVDSFGMSHDTVEATKSIIRRSIYNNFHDLVDCMDAIKKKIK